MAFIPLISCDYEVKLIMGFLLGTGALVVVMVIFVRLAFLHGAHDAQDAAPGEKVIARSRKLLPRLYATYRESCIPKGTLLFLAVGVISLSIVIVLLALAISSICLFNEKDVTYVIVGLSALVFIGGSVICRLGVRRGVR